jgi:hypothetical protein
LIAAVEALPKADRTALAKSLKSITAALEFDGPPPMFFEAPEKKRKS